MSSRTITLFTEISPPCGAPVSFLVSIIAHGVVLGLVYLGIRETPRIYDPFLARQYTVRFLNLSREEPQIRRFAPSGVVYPAPQSAAQTPAPGGRPPAPSSTPRQVAQSMPASQTLVQPDIPPSQVLPQVPPPLPMMVLWSQQNSLARKIVPPPIHETTVADVLPTVEPPNHESNLADLRISSTAFTADTSVIPPSTSSPLVVRGPNAEKQIPETTSRGAEPRTPAQVISISDLQMRQGIVALPLINETAIASSPRTQIPGQSQNSSRVGSSNSDSSDNGVGSGKQAGELSDESAASGDISGQRGTKSSSAAKANSGADSGSGSGNDASVTRITLPKNGQFGFVVVGSSLEEEYPETVGLWTDRLAYTVYLHVGPAKNWILQYSLPRSADIVSAGSGTRLQAPWPYYMVRPNLAQGDLNADALIIHGFVSRTGRFETMAVVFPPQFAQAKFVLAALQDWQFRPALQDGHSTAAEILLIIPNETE